MDEASPSDRLCNGDCTIKKDTPPVLRRSPSKVIRTAVKWQTRRQVVCLFLVILLPIILLGTLAVLGMVHAREQYKQNEVVKQSVQSAETTRNLLTELQKERGLSCLYLSLPEHSSRTKRRQVESLLGSFRSNTDFALAAWHITRHKTITTERKNLEPDEKIRDYRRQIDHQLIDCDRVLKWYTDINNNLIAGIEQVFRGTDEGTFWSDVQAYCSIIAMKDLIGIKRAVGGSIFTTGKVKAEKLIKFSEVGGAAEKLLSRVQHTVADADALHEKLLKTNQPLVDRLKSFEMDIENMTLESPNSQRGLEWFDNMTQYISLISQVESKLSTIVVGRLELRSAENQHDFLLRVLLLCLNCVFSPALAVAYALHSSHLVRKSEQMAVKRARAKIDKQKTDMVVNNLLPIVSQMANDCKCEQKELAKKLIEDIRNEIITDSWYKKSNE